MCHVSFSFVFRLLGIETMKSGVKACQKKENTMKNNENVPTICSSPSEPIHAAVTVLRSGMWPVVNVCHRFQVKIGRKFGTVTLHPAWFQAVQCKRMSPKVTCPAVPRSGCLTFLKLEICRTTARANFIEISQWTCSWPTPATAFNTPVVDS